MAVTTTDADGTDDRELDYRALSEYMTVLDDGDIRARSSPDLYTVTTQSGREIDRVALETLSESNTRPDPDAVREYVADAMHSLTTTDREEPER